MKTLVAISSCQHYEDTGLNDPARMTWLHEAKHVGWDYIFFSGHGSIPKDDVVVVDAPDDYLSLTYKTKEKLKWAAERDYDYVFSCFPDTYARPERLLKCLGHDYYGNIYTHPEFGRYCQGGVGYLLSKRAIQELNVSTFPINASCDVWVGQALEKAGIVPVYTPYFVGTGLNWSTSPVPPECFCGPKQNNEVVTCHLSYMEADSVYRPRYMYEMHRRWLES